MKVIIKFIYYILTSMLLLIKLTVWILFFSIFILRHDLKINLQQYIKIPINIEYSGTWNISKKIFFINSINIKSKKNSILNVNKVIIKKNTHNYNINIASIFIDYIKFNSLFSTSNQTRNNSTKEIQKEVNNLLNFIPNLQINIKKIQINNLLHQPLKINLKLSKDSTIVLSSKINKFSYNNTKIPESIIHIQISEKENFPFKMNIISNDNNIQAYIKGTLLPLYTSYNLHIQDITKILKIKTIEGIKIKNSSLKGNFLQNDSLIKIDSLYLTGINLYNIPLYIKLNNTILKNNIISIPNIKLSNGNNTINLSLNYNLNNNIVNVLSKINLQQIPKSLLNIKTKIKGNIKASNFNIKKLKGKIKTNLIIQSYLKNDILTINLKNNINIDNYTATTKDFTINIFGYNLNISGFYNFNKNLANISGKLNILNNKFNINRHMIITDSLKMHLKVQNTLQKFFKLDFMIFANKITIDTLNLKKIIILGNNLDITNLKSGNFKLQIKGLYENNKILLPDIFANIKFIGEKKLLLNPIIIKINNKDYLSLNSIFNFFKFPYTLKLNNSYLKYDIFNLRLSMKERAVIDNTYNLFLPHLKVSLDTIPLIEGNGVYNILNSSSKFNIISYDIPIDSLTKKLSYMLNYEIPIEEGILNFSSKINIDSSYKIKTNSNIKIKNFFLYNYFIDSININISSNKKSIILEKLNIDNPDNNFMLKGNFNFSPINYDFILSGNGELPTILTDFIDSLYMISGKFDLNTKIQGNNNKIKLNGNMFIDSTELYFTFLDNKISNFKADILLKDDSIIINEISANTEEIKRKKNFSLFNLFKKRKIIKNNIAGNGKICINDFNFLINTKFKNIFLRYLPIKSDFTIDGDLSISKLHQLPYIKGDLYFKEFNLTDNFNDYIASPDDSIYVFYNITLHFPNNFWIKNKYVNLEAGGNIKLWLENSKELPEIYGSLDVKRGEVYVYGYTFKINKGQIKFTEANKLNPEFDISATTKIKDLTITLYFKGTLQNPEFDFTSYPIVLSREEIIKYFFGTITNQVQNNNISNQAENIMSGILMHKISQVGVQKLGFDQFKLSSNNQQETTGMSEIIDRLRFSDLQIGKYITPNLFISYKGKLNLTGEKSVSIEYYLNNNFSLIGEKKFDGNYKMGLRFKTDF